MYKTKYNKTNTAREQQKVKEQLAKKRVCENVCMYVCICIVCNDEELPEQES